MASNKYRGRYSEPVPTSNLLNDEDDFPEFEPFEGEVKPRGVPPAGGSLWVQKVDMCQDKNKKDHFTADYDMENLVVRRGKEFLMKVTFNRPLMAEDDFQVEFRIGTNPSASKGSLEVVTFGSRRGGSWSGKTAEVNGATLKLEIKPTADAIVGKFRTNVAIMLPDGIQRTKRDATTDLYLLFNTWCEDETVFLAQDEERKEYVLNDAGVIYQGSADALSYRTWVYGQFEQGILDACIFILDSSKMPIADRGNTVKVIRKGSAMINSQDDDGVLVGNWSDDYSMGTPPMVWTGSVKILQQFASTGVPVCFAQCWVFAGVFNTFLRCLGIPARVVTNFNSAHDNTGNLKTDLIFKADGTPDRRHTKDSIWNYHCWNEVFMKRIDLPADLSGWQVVDATPQETSDGHFRCGPASVSAIRSGLVCHPFDAGFVFAEVNSDVVFHMRDKYGTLTPFKVDRTHVGKAIYTKDLGSTVPVDITENYKYDEGSTKDKMAMDQAVKFGCGRNNVDLIDTQLLITIDAEEVFLGQDVVLDVVFENQADLPRIIQAHLSGSVVFYTGITTTEFKDHDFTVIAPANQKERVTLKVMAEEYLPHLGSQLSLSFTVTGRYDAQRVTAMKTVELQTPELNLKVSGRAQVKQEMFVEVSFTNPFDFPLQRAHLVMEGSGLLTYRSRFYSTIGPQATIFWKESFRPRLAGTRCLAALLYCYNLHQVFGYVYIDVMP